MLPPNHRVRAIIRLGYGLTIADVSELSGLAVGTIRRIEEGNPYHVNHQTAELLADALDVQVSDLFEPGDLSELGRPPATGRRLASTTRDADMPTCPGCGMLNPAALSECDYCGADLT